MTRKRGRPKSIISKTNRVGIRLSDFEKSMLAELCVDYDKSASDIMRNALNVYYKQIHFYDFNEGEMLE